MYNNFHSYLSFINSSTLLVLITSIRYICTLLWVHAYQIFYTISSSHATWNVSPTAHHRLVSKQNKVNEVNITKIENCAHCKSFCVLCDLFYKKITANITFWRLTPLIFGEHFQVIFATWLDSRNTLLFWCLSKLSRPIVRRKYLHKVHIIPLNISKK